MAGPAEDDAPLADPSVVSSARRKTPFELSITVAGRYRRGACIARGGSSTVHRATDLASGAEVALKSFHVHRAFDASLLPELGRARELAARVGPDVMVPILDLGADDDGTPFVVMPLLEGETLGERLERGPLDDAEALRLAARLLVGLTRLHEAGATHGDLSPDNVLLRRDGHVLLVDHESVGAIGAERPRRATAGFGAGSGPRAARDDHRALVVMLHVLTGRAPPTLSDDAIDALVRALVVDPNAAADALGWASRREGSGVLALVVTAIVTLSLLGLAAWALER